jgi:hypothetical protein
MGVFLFYNFELIDFLNFADTAFPNDKPDYTYLTVEPVKSGQNNCVPAYVNSSRINALMKKEKSDGKPLVPLADEVCD